MTAEYSDMAGVVLAAGAGTRYGLPKAGALLPDGTRFVDRVVQRLAECGVGRTVVVLHPDVEPPAPPSHSAQPTELRIIVNRRPDSEQIMSVRLGLSALANTGTSGALIWPVDHPLVTDAAVAHLLQRIRESDPLLALPSHQGKHGHPAYFRRDLWRELLTVAEGGARSVVHQHAADILEVPVDDIGVCRNVDRPEDLP